MPEKQTIQRARKAERKGKSPSSQAGEFVREEIHHVRKGKHGARSTEQAIAIGLSKARRAGVHLPPPKTGSTETKEQAARDVQKGKHRTRKKSPKRARAVRGALEREGTSAASRAALSRHAKTSAAKRGAAARKRAAQKAVRTKGAAGRKRASQKAARTRAARQH